MLIANGVSFEFTLCVASLICHRLPYSSICMRTLRAANKIDLLLRFVAGIQLLLTNNFFITKSPNYVEIGNDLVFMRLRTCVRVFMSVQVSMKK